MKLKKKSMYLIHLVQPSTPMVNVRQTDSALGSEDGGRYRNVQRTQSRLDRKSRLQLGDNSQLLPPLPRGLSTPSRSQQHSGLLVGAFKIKHRFTDRLRHFGTGLQHSSLPLLYSAQNILVLQVSHLLSNVLPVRWNLW